MTLVEVCKDNNVSHPLLPQLQRNLQDHTKNRPKKSELRKSIDGMLTHFEVHVASHDHSTRRLHLTHATAHVTAAQAFVRDPVLALAQAQEAQALALASSSSSAAAAASALSPARKRVREQQLVGTTPSTVGSASSPAFLPAAAPSAADDIAMDGTGASILTGFHAPALVGEKRTRGGDVTDDTMQAAAAAATVSAASRALAQPMQPPAPPAPNHGAIAAQQLRLAAASVVVPPQQVPRQDDAASTGSGSVSAHSATETSAAVRVGGGAGGGAGATPMAVLLEQIPPPQVNEERLAALAATDDDSWRDFLSSDEELGGGAWDGAAQAMSAGNMMEELGEDVLEKLECDPNSFFAGTTLGELTKDEELIDLKFPEFDTGLDLEFKNLCLGDKPAAPKPKPARKLPRMRRVWVYNPLAEDSEPEQLATSAGRVCANTITTLACLRASLHVLTCCAVLCCAVLCCAVTGACLPSSAWPMARDRVWLQAPCCALLPGA